MEQQFIDDRLMERPLLSLREIRDELKHHEYRSQFTRKLAFLTKKVFENDPIRETRFSYHEDPQKRLPTEIKEQLKFTRDFLNEKLQNWQPYSECLDPSGATGAVFGWLYAKRIIDQVPEFSKDHEEGRHDPYIIFENGVNFAIFHCYIKTDPKEYGSLAAYTTIKVRLDEKLINNEDENENKMIAFYDSLLKRRKKIGGVVRMIREFDERKNKST